jgi:tetratricopeptide (TPR) repeat protein
LQEDAMTAGRTDVYGYPLTCASDAAAERYRAGQLCMLAHGPEPGELLEQAIALDREFALAHAALGLVRARELRIAEARGAAGTASSLAATATPRERSHVQVVEDAVGGRTREAIARARRHLESWPRDALLLMNAASALLFSGRQDEMMALTESLAGAYGDDWYFLGQHAFALEEIRRFDEARAAAERSLTLFRQGAFTAHALAHVFYETGDHEQGSAFMPAWMADYDRRGGMFLHLSWHEALFLLARGEYSELLSLYDRAIHPSAQPGSFQLYDPISLIWRLDLYDLQHPGLWASVDEVAAARAAQAGMIFSDLHHGMALAATGRQAELERLYDSLRERGNRGNLAAGEVALPLLQGMAAYAAGDFAQTVRLIAPIEERIYLVGGSRAQREVFHDTLLEALLRTERFEDAEARLRERLDRRPSPRDLFRMERVHAAQRQPASSA